MRIPPPVTTLAGIGEHRTFAAPVAMRYNDRRKRTEVKAVADRIKFETFVDAQGTAFQEYVSSITAKLPKADKEYRAIRDKMEGIFQQYPRVMDVFDTEQAAALTEKECAALIQAMGLQNQLVEIEIQTLYLRGCYDGVGYLKKACVL